MSDKTAAEKLLIKPGSGVWCSDPAQLASALSLPDGVRHVRQPGEADVALLVAADGASLRAVVQRHGVALGSPSVLWVVYPKGNRTDLNRHTVWPVLAELGLRPIAQVALDEVFSALRFRPLRSGEEFQGHVGA